MAYIELVIKIPEEVKNRLCFGVTYAEDIQTVCEALRNGTPLPKGHGRLIDSDELSNRLLERWDIADKNMEKLVSNVMADIVCPIVIGTPTIIEKERKEEK